MMSVGAAVLMVLAVLELLSAISYSVINGGVVYREKRLPRSRTGLAPDEPSSKPKTILHPVLGFVNRPGITVQELIGSDRVSLIGSLEDPPEWALARTNGDGFFSPVEYPRRKESESEFLVGVFGGSVAQWLAVQTGEYMASGIQKLERFEGRRVRVLAFAQGGFKYPQQIQALSYFSSMGQSFDVVVDISGFNEVALSSFNSSRGVEAGWPSFMHLGPMLQLIASGAAPPEIRSLLSRIQSDTARAAKLNTRVDESRVASLWLLRSLLLRIVEGRLDSAQTELSLASSTGDFQFISVPRVDTPSDLEDTCREAALQWSRGVSMMRALARSIDAEFIEVLQPNQYFSGHEFSSGERSLALSPRSVFREPVEAGYPLLRAAVDDLRKEGVHVIDAVDVFDSESRPVFADNCCHYNDLGNRILVDRIIEELGPVLVARLHRSSNP